LEKVQQAIIVSGGGLMMVMNCMVESTKNRQQKQIQERKHNVRKEIPPNRPKWLFWDDTPSTEPSWL